MGKRRNAWSKNKKNKPKNNESRQQAKENYFSQGLGNASHIDAKRPFQEAAGIRDNAVHLYGCDFMSSVDIVEVFAPHVKKLEWIDDSNVNLLCHDAQAADEVLSSATACEGDAVWRTKDASYVDSVDSAQRHVRLELRPCTFADTKDPNRQVQDSTYYKWNTARTLEENEKKRQKREGGTKMQGSISTLMDPMLAFGVKNSLAKALEKGNDSNSIDTSQGLGQFLKDQENAFAPITTVHVDSNSASSNPKNNGQRKNKRRLSMESASSTGPYDGFTRFLPKSPLAPVNRAIGFLRAQEDTKDLKIKVLKVISPYGHMIQARRKKDIAAKKRGEEVPKTPVGSLWTEWLGINKFPTNPLLVHCLMFRKQDPTKNGKNECDHFLVLVPHPLLINMDKVATAIGLKLEDIKKVSVKECHGASGFPIFVCPPIGHEFSLPVKERMALEKKRAEEKEKASVASSPPSETITMEDSTTGESKSKPQESVQENSKVVAGDGSMEVTPSFSFAPKPVSLSTGPKINQYGDRKEPPFVMFDSSLVDCNRPLLFDCGQSALLFNNCADLVRATKANAVDGLATPAPPS